MPHGDIAISVRGLNKAYTIAHDTEHPTTLGEAVMQRLRRPFAKPSTETFWALRDVNLEVTRGDVVGVIGRNGAGKSTLLKILSRITEPSEGCVEVHGRVGSLLEVGTGFHPELTGRENVYLNGAILGMRRAEITRHFDAIVEFAEIERFLDTPVKRYSSGMYVRLAFAVAAHLESEILIVDEVLAVGDSQFQRKCLGKMKEVSVGGGRTVLFVSHNIPAVRSLCGHAVLLSGGVVASSGATDDVLDQYLAEPVERRERGLQTVSDRAGTGEIRCTGIKLLGTDGRSLTLVAPNQPFRIQVSYHASQPLVGVTVSVDIDSPDGHRVATLYSGFQNDQFSVVAGEGQFECQVRGLPLRSDIYNANVMLGHQHGQYDFIQGAFVIEVEPADVYKTGRTPERAHGALVAEFKWIRQ